LNPSVLVGDRPRQAASRRRAALETAALRFLVDNLDAVGTLCAGMIATLWAWRRSSWRRSEIANRELDALGRPERAIGPLLILYAVLKPAAAS
jgi:hypothetical protein